MPVPVPRNSKLSVHKQDEVSRLKPSVFQQLTHTLPATPAGPPPSFGTREEWINSLPSWRKLKPRRIWDDTAIVGEGCAKQDFPEGLTGAGNASVIKGTHAQACIPPLFTLYNSSLASPHYPCDADADDEMSSGYSVMDHVHDNESQWSASSPSNELAEMEMSDEAHYGAAVEERPGWHRDDGVVFEEHVYEKGAFSPVYEDDSPQMVDGPDATSSPIGPTTPFGDFVDRAVSAVEPYSAHSSVAEMDSEYLTKESMHAYSQYSADYDDCKASEPIPKAIVVSSPASDYQKLVGPLSEWVSTFVWKVCTTGMSLPSESVLQKYAFCPKNTRRGALLTSSNSNGPVKQYSTTPPSYLAVSVHSLLQSTLLQPSAILLALWYIVRLPVYFGAVGFGPEHVKELKFRVELLGDSRGGADREALEMNAPFRLILLGCMLANKWLDDHTFSNKTWLVFIFGVIYHIINILIGKASLTCPLRPSTTWRPLRWTYSHMISRRPHVYGHNGFLNSRHTTDHFLHPSARSPFRVQQLIRIQLFARLWKKLPRLLSALTRRSQSLSS